MSLDMGKGEPRIELIAKREYVPDERRSLRCSVFSSLPRVHSFASFRWWRVWPRSPEGKWKTPHGGGDTRRWLLGMSLIVPVSGLALAPWRHCQVAGRSAGQNPRASLDTYSIVISIIAHTKCPVNCIIGLSRPCPWGYEGGFRNRTLWCPTGRPEARLANSDRPIASPLTSRTRHL